MKTEKRRSKGYIPKKESTYGYRMSPDAVEKRLRQLQQGVPTSKLAWKGTRRRREK